MNQYLAGLSLYHFSLVLTALGGIFGIVCGACAYRDAKRLGIYCALAGWITGILIAWIHT